MQGAGNDLGGTGEYPAALMRAVDAAFAPWFAARLREIAGTDDDRFAGAVEKAAAWVNTELAAQFSVDVETQRMNPLQLIRSASRFAAPVFAALGVPVPQRDEFETRAMPEDEYGIGPLAWIDLGEEVHEAGITWGAWKAAVIISRHRTEG